MSAMQSIIRTSTRDVGKHTSRPEYNLVSRVRAIGAGGIESLIAVEKYDVDFPAKLSACLNADAAEAVLVDWLDHRTATLGRTQADLRKAWAELHVIDRPVADRSP
jgi:hypothetical protein